MADQKYNVFLTFKDAASGKFTKATLDMVDSMRKLGIAVKTEGNSVSLNMDKMANSTKKTNYQLKEMRGVTAGLRHELGSIRNALLVWFFALRPVIDLTKSAITAAIAQEDAEMKLAAAFRATGRGSAESLEHIKAYASELQRTIGVSDDQVISASAVLAKFKLTESQIKRVLPLVVDLNTAMKRNGDENANLEGTAKMVGTALTKTTTYLERMGVTIDDTTRKTKDFDSILKAIEGAVGGTGAAMATTYSGQFGILKAAIGDLAEEFGMMITKSPVVVSSMRMITGSVIEMTDRVKESRETTDSFRETWLKFSASMIGIGTAIKALWRIILIGLKEIIVITLKVSEAFTTLTLRIFEMNKKVYDTIPFMKKYSDICQKVIDQNEILKETYKNAANSIQDEVNATIQAISEMGTEAVDTYADIVAGANAVSEAQKSGLEGLKSVTGDITDEIGNTFNAMETFMSSAVTGMRDSLVDGFFNVIHGEFDSLSDVVVSFGDMMLKTILQIMVNMALIKIGLGPYLGFPGGLSAHTGGYMFNLDMSQGYRKKFHSGGEVPATLLEGEGVLNKKGMASLGVDNLNRLNRGESFGGGPAINNYYIQAIDVKSFRDRLQEHGDIYVNSSDMAIRDNGALRKTTQRWG